MSPAAEEGAIAVTVGVMLLALIGVSMLAIDGGALFTSRRNVLVDTDAAALASARAMVGMPCTTTNTDAAQAIARDVLASNDAFTTTPTAPLVSCVGAVGRATVSAVRTTDLMFGGIAGLPEVDVKATSVAQYGPISAGTGLRPIALCDKDPHFLEFARDAGYVTTAQIEAMLPGQAGVDLRELVDAVKADADEHLTTGRDGGSLPAGSKVHRVVFSRSTSTSGCGAAAGNWGWLDFDGGGGGGQQLRDWLRHGYPGTISVGPGEDCAPEVSTETDCIGEPGAGGNAWSLALEDIACASAMTPPQCAAAGRAFPVTLFTSVVCTGTGPNACAHGANARYDHVAFVGIVLRDWAAITGNPNDLSWLGIEFVDPFLASGVITGVAPAIGPGLAGVQLCGGGYGGAVDDYCVVP